MYFSSPVLTATALGIIMAVFSLVMLLTEERAMANWNQIILMSVEKYNQLELIYLGDISKDIGVKSKVVVRDIQMSLE